MSTFLVYIQLSDINRITSIVNCLDYNENATDICGGLTDAFDFVSSHEMNAGEIFEIILITDGIPYLSDGGNDQSAIADASKVLKERIQNTPEVIVHSACFGDWESDDIYGAVSQGKGLHEQVNSELNCTQAGEEIAKFTDSLYKVDLKNIINIYEEHFDVDIISLDSHETVTVKNIRNFDQADYNFLTIDPSLIDGKDEITEKTTDETKAEPTTVSETTKVQETTQPATTNRQFFMSLRSMPEIICFL